MMACKVAFACSQHAACCFAVFKVAECSSVRHLFIHMEHAGAVDVFSGDHQSTVLSVQCRLSPQNILHHNYCIVLLYTADNTFKHAHIQTRTPFLFYVHSATPWQKVAQQKVAPHPQL